MSADHRAIIKEMGKVDKHFNFVTERKKTVEHEGDGDTDCSWCTWNGLQKIGEGPGAV